MLPPQRVAFLVPSSPDLRGNATHAGRKRKLLEDAGFQVESFAAYPDPDLVSLGNQMQRFRPDVLVAFHAWRCGPPALHFCNSFEQPLVVVTTGTDLDPGLGNPEQREVVGEVMACADAVVVQHAGHRDLIAKELGADLARKTHVVTPSIELVPQPERRDACREVLGVGHERLLFVQVAGIRPVKGNAEILPMLDRLKIDLDFDYALIGSVLDDEYAMPVLQWIAERSWAHHQHGIDHRWMIPLQSAADVTLNSSRAEGMSNAILESMACGTPVIASDILSNRAVLPSSAGGRLYANEQEFREAVLIFSESADIRARVGQEGQAWVREHHSPAQEQTQLLDVLRKL